MKRLSSILDLQSFTSLAIQNAIQKHTALWVAGDDPWEWEGSGSFLLIEPHDTLKQIEEAAKWSLFANDAQSTFEFINQYDAIFLIDYLLSDAGQFLVLIVDTSTSLDPALIQFCETHYSSQQHQPPSH
jgi:hypothetical protein